MPPPAPSARFPDQSPPSADPAPEDQGQADDDQDSLLGDLLAPFDRVRRPRPPLDDPDDVNKADVAADTADETQQLADEEQQSPPPPPASARFPDTPPPSALIRTRARTPAPAPAPAPSPPLPPGPPHVEAPDARDAEDEQHGADYPLRPPMPPAPPSDPVAALISAPAPDPSTAPLPPPPPSPRTTAARRAVGAVDLTPGPGAGRPFVSFARPAMYDDSTTRLRPVRTWAQPRVSAAAACVVLGLGLIGGAATGSWLTGGSEGAGTTRSTYAMAGQLWHSVPVDQLFPATIKGEGAGPGGADRTWTRVAVAPDSPCKNAFDPLLRKALAPAGCLRLLRATYTDATRSHVTTVGLLFTKADADAMRSLRTRFTEEGLDRRPDLMPRPYAAKGTPAADFGDAQRASWTVSVLPDAPVVAFSVSGFADGRTVTEPEPADEAMKTSATSAPAQAGLGNEARGIADRVERRLRKTIAATEKSS
ncbi:hypothetical protein OG302_33545 [Streptomyces sp. NBC_01283]|uniref:hypothetical protein n=1 Tax=Streptomyces sp. NBC_01283 TaxID=2903812 RepID=UPI00352BE01C|nr:hypothetical protein OG302_33545 [Streptomyces sp. NBC_01283]